MSTEKKGITVKIDADLHAEIKQYLEQNGITMAQFIEQAVEDELHPKNQIMEENNMEKMRTLAFQVPEDLFNKIKDYLHRNNISQKQFVIGLIEREIDRDITEREGMKEQPKLEEESDEEQSEGQYNEEILDGTDEPTDAPDEDEELTEQCEPDEEQGENEENSEESEDEDIDEDEEETEGMSMTGM